MTDQSTPERPQDRKRRKQQQKDPTRIVNMQLDLTLTEAIEVIAEDQGRSFCNTINILLRWAAWAYSCDQRPFLEMMERPGGFTAWNENIRVRLEAQQLEALFSAGEETEGRSS